MTERLTCNLLLAVLVVMDHYMKDEHIIILKPNCNLSKVVQQESTSLYHFLLYYKYYFYSIIKISIIDQTQFFIILENVPDQLQTKFKKKTFTIDCFRYIGQIILNLLPF